MPLSWPPAVFPSSKSHRKDSTDSRLALKKPGGLKPIWSVEVPCQPCRHAAELQKSSNAIFTARRDPPKSEDCCHHMLYKLQSECDKSCTIPHATAVIYNISCRNHKRLRLSCAYFPACFKVETRVELQNKWYFHLLFSYMQ